jgi:hypothetical protein
VNLEPKKGLGKDKIHGGGNSGYQVMNLVYLFGATKIFLLGYDMKLSGGKTHWHGDHPGDLNRDLDVKTFAKNFPALADDLKAEGVEVFNVSRETALECFKKVDIENVLK